MATKSQTLKSFFKTLIIKEGDLVKLEGRKLKIMWSEDLNCLSAYPIKKDGSIDYMIGYDICPGMKVIKECL